MNEKTMDKRTRGLLDAAKSVLCGGDFRELESAVKAFEDDETATILRGISTAIGENKLSSHFDAFQAGFKWTSVKHALQSAIEAWEEKHREGDESS